jgi:hypothetical protein
MKNSLMHVKGPRLAHVVACDCARLRGQMMRKSIEAQRYGAGRRNISLARLPLAWTALGLDPADYAHLDGGLQNRLLKISNRFAPSEWARLWAVFRLHQVESALPSLFRDAFVQGRWVRDRSAEPIAVLEAMTYHTGVGERQGDLELVRCGATLGFRLVDEDANVKMLEQTRELI